MSHICGLDHAQYLAKPGSRSAPPRRADRSPRVVVGAAHSAPRSPRRPCYSALLLCSSRRLITVLVLVLVPVPLLLLLPLPLPLVLLLLLEFYIAHILSDSSLAAPPHLAGRTARPSRRRSTCRRSRSGATPPRPTSARRCRRCSLSLRGLSLPVTAFPWPFAAFPCPFTVFAWPLTAGHCLSMSSHCLFTVLLTRD